MTSREVPGTEKTHTKRTVPLYAATLALLLLISGCGRQAGTPPLRVGVLPILDTLPVFVARQERIFAEYDVEVELISVASAAERDQLLQAGKLDAIITDLVALALYNRDGPRVVAVRYAMRPTPAFPQFRVMTAPGSGISEPRELAGVPVGVSEGTVIEYVTHRLLEAEGLSADQVETVAVPKIPERMALLRAGELKAATLPEPLASLALQDGARVIADDSQHVDTSCSVYALRRKTVETRPEAVRGFLMAISQASAAINEDKTRWSRLLTEENLVPAPLLASYELPDYPADRLPTQAQFADAVDWLIETGRLSDGPRYEDVFDASLLP